MTMLAQRTLGIAGLDHVVIAVRDLGAASETFTRMGFTLAPRGLHNTGSSNHNVMLGSDYFELLHVPRPHPMMAYFYQFLQNSEGLAALALRDTDTAATHAALMANGFEPDPTRALSREVSGGSRSGLAHFSVTNLAAHTTPGAQVFLCQHHTPELVWLPELQRHANTATGIAAVAFATDKVAHQASLYAKMLGAWPERIDEGMKVDTGSAPLAFCTPQALQARLREVELPKRSGPHPAALFIRVADRQAAYRCLYEGGLAPKRMSDGSVAVDAGRAYGVAMVFG